MVYEIDVVIPAHEKDVDTLDLCIGYVKKNVKNLHKVYVVSRNKLTNNAEWIPENTFPFKLEDVIDMIGKHKKTCWYYAGLIQTTAAYYLPDLKDYVLILDSDTMFIKPVEFVNDNGISLFNVSPTDGTGLYYEHMKKLVPGLTPQYNWSGVAHHIIINKKILKSLIEKVEELHKVPFWKADILVTLEPYSSCPNEHKYKNKHAEGPGRFTSYELYFSYAMKYFPNLCRVRKLNSIMAYKGKIPAPDMLNLSQPSRTNLQGNIQVLSKEEENKLKFETVSEALEYLSKICIEKGFETVTFQNHTRIGSSGNSKVNVDYLNDIFK